MIIPSKSIMTSALAGRVTSAFPVSLPTSMALESLFAGRQAPYDAQRQIPQRIDIQHYKECWLSLGTLFRNMCSSTDKVQLITVTPSEFQAALEQEVDIINNIFDVEGRGVCRPIFYYCDYTTPYTKQRHAAVKTREDKTDAQRHMTAMLSQTMRSFLKANKGQAIRHLDHEIVPDQPVPALVITHVPHDLLSYTHFKKLDLLESHTGKLKPRNLWYTKYHGVGSEDLSTLPFLRKLLLIFGDSVMFQPMDIRFRKMILEVSRARHWSPLTTEPKIIQDLSLDIKEPYLVEMFKAL